jgi:hypothetical protein
MSALPMIGMIPTVSMRKAAVNAYGTPIIGKKKRAMIPLIKAAKI